MRIAIPRDRIGATQRLRGLLRNAGPVYGRAGAGGLIELIAARALPTVLSYRRLVVLGTSLERGELHPELDPRRVRAPGAVTDLLHARLARIGEPGLPIYSPEVVARRFAAGDELWLFHVDGRVAHARWLMRDRLYLAGAYLLLEEGEYATDGAVTLPEFRNRGLAVAARQHLRAVLGTDGGATMLSVVSGVNRRFLKAARGLAGVDRLGTVHIMCLAGRQWVRAAPASSPGAQLLGRAGLHQPGAR